MPVKNALPYLDRAVESILGQTFGDFEFVILDDGSDDGSLERLYHWASRDDRIRIVEGSRSRGPVGSSNLVVAHSRAPIIARMDADDISAPHRLQWQIEVLHSYPDAALVGSVWEGIDRQDRLVREPDVSTLEANGFAAPFAHGSIMFRRDAFERAGGYRPACEYWEDLDLYLRMARHGQVLVIPQPLYRHRFSEISTRLTSRRREVEEAVDLMFRCRAAYERGEDYEPLLAERGLEPGSRKLHPYAFLSLGFITLWSGLRPPALKRLLRTGDLGLNSQTMKALVWASWAAVSPLSLRKVMRARLARRNRSAASRFETMAVCEWRPSRVLRARQEPGFSVPAPGRREDIADPVRIGAATPAPVRIDCPES
jgi:glycosyltransferase involved in cell wall biosynthesis